MQSFRLIHVPENEPFTIGRKSDNCLVIDNLMVSRYHAVLEPSSGNWSLRNLTKNSVTQLNGNDIECSEDSLAVINDGDVIQIGTNQLKVTFKKNNLSLLLMESADHEVAYSIALNDSWIKLQAEEVDIPTGISAKIQNNPKAAILQFKSKIFDSKKRSITNFVLPEGESIRFPSCQIGFTNGELICKNMPLGFDVKAYNLDVFAGKQKLVKDINFELRAGEILTIIGRSGQGKSSLLRLFQGKNHAGKNSNISIGSLDYRNSEIRKHIAFLEQDNELRQYLTVKETLLDCGRISMSKDDFQKNSIARVEKLCDLLGLTNRLNHYVKTLSGGEKRRVALAKELMGNPGLIILDEPLSGLDPYNSKILCTHLKQLSFLGHTIILTTHSYEALQIADKVLVLHQGEQCFFGTPEASFQFFKNRDPEKILSNLNDDTSLEWQKTFLHQDNPYQFLKTKDQPSRFFFPQKKCAPTFWYKILLSSRQWFRDTGKFLTLILQPLIIGLLFSQIFSELSNCWIITFAIVLCANWFALSLSIREIIQEKSILIGEFRKGSSIITTLTAKLLLSSIVAWIQIFVVYALMSIRTNSPLLSSSLALILLAATLPPVAVGLMVSSFAKNSGQANALLPLLIIPQVALAGALVPLDQMLPLGRILSTVIWSKYNQNSLFNLLLEHNDPIENILCATAIALGCYIVTVIHIHHSTKAK
ncbi:MAG: ATP-binding cassette domain-containing protein [Fibrobacter sp.]|nr:ATP-binding cassette domain-containing protein [Fibrobacter sp.]